MNTHREVIFITQALGYNGNLLYWNNIFHGIGENICRFNVFYPGPNIQFNKIKFFVKNNHTVSEFSNKSYEIFNTLFKKSLITG